MHQFEKFTSALKLTNYSHPFPTISYPPNTMFFWGFAPSKGNRCHRCVDHARFQLHCPRHVPWSPPWHPGRWPAPRLPPSPRRGPNWKTLGISWHQQCPRMPTKPYVEPCCCWTNVWSVCQESFSQMLWNPKTENTMFISFSMSLWFSRAGQPLRWKARQLPGHFVTLSLGFPAGQGLVTVAFNPTARRPTWNTVRKSTRVPNIVSTLSLSDITVLLLQNIWSFPERCMGTSLRTKTCWTMMNSYCALFPHLEPRLFSGVTGSITPLVMEDGRHTKRLSERFGCQIIALYHHILEFVFPVYHLFHSYQVPWWTFFRIQNHIGVMFSICQQNVAWAAEIAGNITSNPGCVQSWDAHIKQRCCWAMCKTQ